MLFGWCKKTLREPESNWRPRSGQQAPISLHYSKILVLKPYAFLPIFTPYVFHTKKNKNGATPQAPKTPTAAAISKAQSLYHCTTEGNSICIDLSIYLSKKLSPSPSPGPPFPFPPLPLLHIHKETIFLALSPSPATDPPLPLHTLARHKIIEIIRAPIQAQMDQV